MSQLKQSAIDGLANGEAQSMSCLENSNYAETMNMMFHLLGLPCEVPV